ncbi:hypothetical protein [Enterocloster lavalensis]|uniref:hypothetical protein n=1 Tax=Enterocloster lavalensis TaxID=460384 RepID=UPI002FD9CC3A
MGIRGARVIQVIKTKEIKGVGTEKDPVREVIQYWSLDGKPLATSDPCLASNNMENTYGFDEEVLERIVEERREKRPSENANVSEEDLMKKILAGEIIEL